jgi:hypothetical protein
MGRARVIVFSEMGRSLSVLAAGLLLAGGAADARCESSFAGAKHQGR